MGFPFKREKRMTIAIVFRSILDRSKRKPNKYWLIIKAVNSVMVLLKICYSLVPNNSGDLNKRGVPQVT